MGGMIPIFQSTVGQFDPAISAIGDGRFSVVVRQNDVDGSLSNLYLSMFDSADQPIGSTRRVHENSQNHQEHASVKMKNDGSVLVLWDSQSTDGSGTDVFYRQFDASLRRNSPRVCCTLGARTIKTDRR